LRGLLCKWVSYVGFVWVYGALNRQKRRFSARAVRKAQAEAGALAAEDTGACGAAEVCRGAWTRVTIDRSRRLALSTFQKHRDTWHPLMHSPTGFGSRGRRTAALGGLGGARRGGDARLSGAATARAARPLCARLVRDTYEVMGSCNFLRHLQVCICDRCEPAHSRVHACVMRTY
jgi:hypothetical protein